METKDKKHSSTSWKYTAVVMVLALLTWVLTLLGKDNPEKVEQIYSSYLYPFIIKKIGSVTGLLPFAIGEILVFTLIVIIIMGTLYALIKPGIVIKNAKKIFHVVIRVLGLAYILFYFIWGFNYFRQDYMTLAEMSVESATLKDLENLTLEVIAKANEVRIGLNENEEGIFFIEEDFKTLGKKAEDGFENYYVGERNLGGNYGKAKPLKISKWMSYTGITGIYFPYTVEPNVNIDIPHANIPATMSHEMGHQRGFAREDEANLIAYMACTNSPHPEFQYSGYYLALQYLLGDMHKQDQVLYSQVTLKISDAVKRDMNDEYDYWKSREGKAEEVATTLNDNYLKANNQGAGVQSYNGVVKLLLAEYLTRAN
ncbi:MAG TPA: DUF3810 domain-containing protein [Epulopiscium sp.]|nr:DUF3810 domain-containing protein [Candidatus Epulonipiscium sp.]